MEKNTCVHSMFSGVLGNIPRDEGKGIQGDTKKHFCGNGCVHYWDDGEGGCIHMSKQSNYTF